MQSTDIFFLVVGVISALAGIASLVTGKIYLMGSASKYTEESLRKYARINGVLNLIAGLGIIAMNTLNGELIKVSESFSITVGMAILAVAIVVCIVVALATRKMLVKK